MTQGWQFVWAHEDAVHLPIAQEIRLICDMSNTESLHNVTAVWLLLSVKLAPVFVLVDATGIHEAHKDDAAHKVPDPAADPHAYTIALPYFALPPCSCHVGTQAGVQLSTTHHNL